MGRRGLLVFALLIGALALLIDAWAIEPFRLEVTHHEIAAPITAPLTIAHLSDLHTKGLGRHEETLLAALETEKPDLIVISGDTVTNGRHPEVTAEVLSRLHAPLGVWLVLGNWEHWHPARKPEKFYAAAGVSLLINQSAQVRDDVWIAGFDDAMIGKPDLEAGLTGIPAGAFVIGLFHAPAFFDIAAPRVPLSFAGHTHGGQIRIPFLPPFWLPRGSGGYMHGWYEHGASRMYVSRGIGTSVVPFRFNCEPELAIIRLTPMTTGTSKP
jgi:predicted MPP superfamily phosphohydrolase